MDPRGLVSVWEESAARFPHRVAARQCGRQHNFREFTYRELITAARRLALALRELGVRPGDHIGLLCRESPEWAVATIAVFYTGGVLVPLGTSLTPEEIRFILHHSEAGFLIVDQALGSRLEPLRGELPHLIQLVVGEDPATPLPEPARLSFNPAKEKQGEMPEITPPPVEHDTLALIVYTSGTTADPKGVMLSHHNVLSDAEASLEVFNLYAGRERYLSVLPLSHMLEFTAGLICMMKIGTTITYAHSLAPRELMFLLRESRPTLIVGVPLLFRKLKKGIEDKLSALPMPLRRLFIRSDRSLTPLARLLVRRRLGGALKLIITGGAAIEPEVLHFYQRLGIVPLQGYGLTETSPVATVTRIEDPRIGSIGKAIPGVEVKLANLDEHGVGEIIIRGPNVMLGYYRNPEATAEAIREGWFYSGDLATVDEDGFFYFKGRAKNLIVTPGGENIFPEEVEHRLELSPLFAEVAVFGFKPEGETEALLSALIVPDREKIAAHLGRNDPQMVTESELREVVREELRRCQRDLAAYKHIKLWRLYEGELPRTPTRKVKPRECQKILAQILAEEAVGRSASS